MWEPKVLVLGSGGARGYLILGALMKLYREEYLNSVEIYVGCSVGALISFCLTIGYKPVEILELLYNCKIFDDLKILLNYKDLFYKRGLTPNDAIKGVLTRALEYRHPEVDTLSKLYSVTGKKLVAVTLNVTDWSVEYTSYETHPDLNPVDAVLRSINIPGIYFELKQDEKIYADGALGDPYPVNLYPEMPTLGIHIGSDYEKPLHPNSSTTSNSGREDFSQDSSSRNNIFSTIKAFFYPMYQLKAMSVKHSGASCKHIECRTNTIDLTGLTLNPDDIVEMIGSGYNSASDFCKKMENHVDLLLEL